MKGIILAGGNGTRLYPATLSISKQLIPIYDKPMIYYPMSVLMLAGIKEILVISSPEHMDLYKKLLGDGSQFGISLSYKIQPKPNGIASAFILGEEFIGNGSVCLILGDNVFYGGNLICKIEECRKNLKGGVVFATHVHDPERYGVVEFDENKKVISIEEKPIKPKSNYAVPGVYLFDNNVIEIAKNVKLSARGELEIPSIQNVYLQQNELQVEKLTRGTAWLDTGTHESLYEASNFVATVEKRQGLKIACLEEIAYNNDWISKNKLLEEAEKYKKTQYGKYLKDLIKE